MVGRFIARPKPGRIKENEEGQVLFRGSEGLWLILIGVAALILIMTIWVVVNSIVTADTGEIPGALIIGGGLCLFLLLGSWFARSQRREIVVDAEGLIMRTREGKEKLRLTWAQIVRIESRFLPSHPTQPAIMFHCADGTSHFIDPLQVYDTSTLIWESERRKKIADETTRAANLQTSRRAGPPGKADSAAS